MSGEVGGFEIVYSHSCAVGIFLNLRRISLLRIKRRMLEATALGWCSHDLVGRNNKGSHQAQLKLLAGDIVFRIHGNIVLDTWAASPFLGDQNLLTWLSIRGSLNHDTTSRPPENH